jgi:hypothetical protein
MRELRHLMYLVIGVVVFPAATLLASLITVLATIPAVLIAVWDSYRNYK